MPTGENSETVGGRVTRSLRKRLTSVDSDVSSRPGTPNNINLQSIPETNTPKKRVTRRASMSTPSAITPSKEPANTPGRRVTRRRSVNISESEDIVLPISKEPTIAVVKEEEPENQTPNEKPKRVLRSSSKSPDDAESKKNNTKLSKNKTNHEEQEVIILDDSVENQSVKLQSGKKKSRVSIKRESLEKEKSYSENDSTPKKKSPNLSASEKNSTKKMFTVETPSPKNNESSNIKEKKNSSAAGSVSPVKSSLKQDSSQTEMTPEKLISHKSNEKQSRSAQKETDHNDVKSSQLIFEQIETSQERPSSKKNHSNTSIDKGIGRLSLTNKNQSSPTRAQSAKKSPLKKNHPEPLKNVAFNEKADENSVKNVYPKTPGLIKSKSYILDVSNDVDKDETFKSKKDQSLEESATKFDKVFSDEEETTGLSTKTPYKLKIMAVESSTPIQNSSPKQNKTSKIEEKVEKSVKENLITEEEKEVVAFPKSWTQSVSGQICETLKIDCIVSEKSLQEKQAQETTNRSKSNSSQNSSKTKIHQHDSDVSEAEDDMLEEDDDEFDDEEERERNAEKTIFLDDEAMEVAEGEESMDSEERAYLEENEVPEYGESIGSEDSEEDDGCDDEPDEEDAAFIVSDTEVIDEVENSEEELEISNQKKLDSSKKKYKRIYQTLESSDEEAGHPAIKDDPEFCLLVDSSYEEENTENAKQSVNVRSPNKSLKNNGNGSDIKDKSLKECSKLDNSKINKAVQEVISEKENGEGETNVSIPPQILNKDSISKTEVSTTVTKSKSEMPETDDFSQKTEEQQPVLKSPEKKKLTKSPKRKSITMTAQDESQNEKPTNSTKVSRNSAEKILACDDDLGYINEKVSASANVENLKESNNKSLNENDKLVDEFKSPHKNTKKLRKSTISDEGNDDVSQKNEEEPAVLKLPEKKKHTKSPKRKSAMFVHNESEDDSKTKDSRESENKGISSDGGFASTNEKSPNQSRKSVSKSTKASANDDNIDVSQRKSINNSNMSNDLSLHEENSKPPKSSNESRKSLIRTSTEETNDIDDQSTLEKTKMSLEEASEPEETLSASENPLDISSGKKLNTSKKLRKSLDRNISLENEQSKEPEKSQRRKSIVQHSITQKASESSAGSEEENEEQAHNILQNEQSNTPEKCKRRKSIAQQSITKKAYEISADSEEDNKEQSNSLQNEQPNKADKSKRRKSIAEHSITKKISESSADLEEEHEEKSSPEITGNGMESPHYDADEAQFSDEENVATDKTISDFLGEEDKSESSFTQNSSRRKSIVANESKLDETFQLDPKSSFSSSIRDNLHRSILRKSLNQSQKRKDTIEANSDEMNEEENVPSDSDEADASSDEEEVNIKKKIVSDKCLSVSLNSIQIKKKKLKDAKAVHNSFTIGVSVRKNFSGNEDSSEAEGFAEKDVNDASSENEDHSDKEDYSSSESKLLNLSEEEVLERVKDVQSVDPYKSRKSMSNSILLAPQSDSDNNQKKKVKRTSLYLEKETASNSFVENLAEEKKKINQKKRKSNSFCGVATPSAEIEDDDQVKEPRSEKKPKKSSESENKDEAVKHVLSRCEQMIEAANEAKRKAKLQAKKVKVKKPKWMDKEEAEAIKEVEEVQIPLVSKKEIKRKEKMKKELAKALKQSASVLSKVEPEKKPKQKTAHSKLVNKLSDPTKRLEAEFLETLMELSNSNKKETKEIETTPPSDKENSKKKSNKLKYKIEDIHSKIESDIETLETACGTVIVEPSTPQKLRFQHGFRESPKTPIGFKIQNIDSIDKKADKKSQKCFRKLPTPSGAFIEEELTKPKKWDPPKQKARKRKLPHIEEPTHTIPKTQWTPSGVFVVEDYANARPLANSTATQFLVASLNSSKKNKPSSEVVSSTTLNTALSFKKKALQRKNLRQESREILHAKQRQTVNNKF